MLTKVFPMSELERLEAMLHARPACLSNEQRGVAYEALEVVISLAAGVRAQQVRPHGVPVEWTSTPVAGISEVLYLHSGGNAMRTLALDNRRALAFPFPQARCSSLNSIAASARSGEWSPPVVFAALRIWRALQHESRGFACSARPEAVMKPSAWAHTRCAPRLLPQPVPPPPNTAVRTSPFPQ